MSGHEGQSTIETTLKIFIKNFHKSHSRIPAPGPFERWKVFICLVHYFRPFERIPSEEIRRKLIKGKLPEDYVHELLVRYDESLDLLECYARMDPRNEETSMDSGHAGE